VYDQARTPFIAWFGDLRPQAVISCVGADEVAHALAFARSHGIDFAVRSGGHCFGGYSSTRGLLIDVSPMCSVVVAGGVASVGTGTHWASFMSG
jgi:FAD/FMN-containing dehydrogenase